MKIFADASAVTRDRPEGELCLALSKRMSIARGLHQRAECLHISWVSTSSSYSQYELLKKAREMEKDFRSRQLREESRDMRNLSTELAAGFVPTQAESAAAAASTTASLVWKLLEDVTTTIAEHVQNGQRRQVVVMSKQEHFQDDAVCRVLYCNHPKTVFTDAGGRETSNGENKGFVSERHEDKHFLARAYETGDESWVDETNSAANRWNEPVSKFKPGITFDSSAYAEIERYALIDAMRKGKYRLVSNDRDRLQVKGNVCACEGFDTVGASFGRKTRKVRLDASNRGLHAYPVPEETQEE